MYYIYQNIPYTLQHYTYIPYLKDLKSIELNPIFFFVEQEDRINDQEINIHLGNKLRYSFITLVSVSSEVSQYGTSLQT